MNPTERANKSKKQLVAQIVKDVKPAPDNEPLAIYAAGIPGAGKTEFLDRLFADTANIVRIDMDEIVKMFDEYTPEGYYKFRGAANIIVDEAVIYCRKHPLDFVLDGTFGSSRAIDNIRSSLKRHKVIVYYVWKEPSLAWQHTKDPQLITKRGVNKSGFIDACINVPKNLQSVRQKFNDKISIAAIKKDLKSDNFQMTRDGAEIDKLLEVRYTRNNLEMIISWTY